MKQKFTLHTHTIGFDGKNTISEMIKRAEELGFTTIGISNHLTIHPDIKNSKFYPIAAERGYKDIFFDNWLEPIEKFTQHYIELDRIKKQTGIQILRGMEVDFFETNQWQTKFKTILTVLKPDYIIGSCHIIEYNDKLYNVHDMHNAAPEIQEQVLNLYWQKVRTAAQSGLFTWMAHLDLPKKVGLGLDIKWIKSEQQTINTLTKNNIPIEINTSAIKTDYDEPYPSCRILKMAAEKNIPVLLSDDAHHISQIGRYFNKAYEIAQKCGIKNFLTLQKTLDFSNKRR